VTVPPEPPATPYGVTSLRTDLCGTLRAADVGRTVTVCGWVAKRREHGEHLAFIDLRDHTGIFQCVVPGTVDVRSEYVVSVEGTVRLRPAGTGNADLPTGEVELGECTVTLLNAAEPPPFAVDDRVDVDEVIRLKHRFVDLRRPKMQANLRLRAKVNGALRAAMDRQGFVEVETPLLWAPTPEGAREFAVPSRIHHGSCYVLPQSPQLAKQLLMVAGLDRYYQIARCLRDEDLRADRQFEFSQLDVEASFVDQEDILGYVSEAVLDAAEVATGVRPGEVRAKQVSPLVIDRTVGAVEVFRALLGTQRAGPEPEHASALVAQREGDAPPETVVHGARAVLGALHEPRREQFSLAEAAAPRGLQHAIPGARREADAKLAQDGLLEAPAGQVLACPCTLLVLPEHPLVVGAGAVQQLEQALLPPAGLGGTRVLLLALERHAVAVGEELDRANELEPLGLHREVEGVTGRLAAEAVVDLPRRLDAERRRAFLVKRAAPDVGVAAGPAQLGARAHEVHHVHGIADSLLGVGGVARHQLANARGTASSW